jgi:hypothetical protein
MITQTIKRWWHKLFARRSRSTSQQVSFTSVDQRTNAALSPESSSYSSVNGLPPQPGVAPLIAGNAQGDRTCSTMNEPPNHPARGSLSPLEKGNTASPGATSPQTPETAASGTALKPTPQQQLDFLNYLVKRGLVNEGFSEDSLPQQYRRRH